MKITRSRATRVALLAASSWTAVAMTSPANAADTWDTSNQALLDFEASNQVLSNWTETWNIMVPHTLTPGTPVVPVLGDPRRGTQPVGVPLPGSDVANSPQVLSSGVNGVGQQLVLALGGGLSLCTGTLINPRTVLTAAHCYYGSAAAPRRPYEYGAQTGTLNIPAAYGFNASNRNQCGAGQAGSPIAGQQVPCYPGADVTVKGAYETWRDSATRATIKSMNIYNVNQIWFDYTVNPVFGGEFANKDIALATLDTHAKGIPTWTMLFSPLDGPTHAVLTGYGGNGSGQYGTLTGYNIDYRRRSAENMLDALMSHNVFWDAADKTPMGGRNHAIYWTDFDDPDRPLTSAGLDPECYFQFVNCTDFGGLGGHDEAGRALPLEAASAGGDSGGPLIVDKRFNKPVVVGVVTGTYSYTGGRGFYGQLGVFPPLFPFWEEIVQNNPYVYASAKAGDGDWMDPGHWVQDMDPNYAIIGPDGQLLNSLPNYNQGGADVAVRQFGTVCAVSLDGSYNDLMESFGQCTDLTGGTNQTGTGSYVVTAGGPGSINFTPNNVEPINSANPDLHRKARYYDVTLREAGKTTLNQAATIDKLTIKGNAALNIGASGDLKVWADFTQASGWTNVDGKLTTDEALITTGLLSGKGVIDPTYLTVVAGMVAPANGDLGTLTIKGDVALASASALHINVMPEFSDKLIVQADPSAGTTGVLALSGGTVLFARAPNVRAPKFGGTWVIASAEGGVDGTFGTAYAGPGVVKVRLSYTANDVIASISANSFSSIMTNPSAVSLAFANALDGLRYTSYDKLGNLFNSIDYMDGNQLAATFGAMSPTHLIGETKLLQDRQSQQLLGNVTDRLSLLGTGKASGVSFSGDAGAFGEGRRSMSATSQLGLTSASDTLTLPSNGKLSGFVTMGGDNVRSSYGDSRLANAGQHSRYFASGIEAPIGDVMVGTAMGYAESVSNAGSDEARSKVTQAAAYATLPIGKNAYVGGVVAAERARTETSRLGTDTTALVHLNGAGQSSRYMANAEAGFRKDIGHGLSLNPRAQVGFSRYSLSGLRERGAETALELNDLTVNRIETRVGARLDGKANVAGWAVRPNIQADYVRLLSGANNGMNVSFAAAPEYQFALPLTNSGSGWAEIKGGIEMTKGRFTLGVSGQATAGDAPLSDQRGAIDLTFRF